MSSRRKCRAGIVAANFPEMVMYQIADSVYSLLADLLRNEDFKDTKHKRKSKRFNHDWRGATVVEQCGPVVLTA